MSKRIYQISTTATTASPTDVVPIDSGAAGQTEQITYANFFANTTAVGNSSTTATLGSLTASTASFTSATATGFAATTATLASIIATTAAAPSAVGDSGTEGEVRFSGGNLYHYDGSQWWQYAGSTGW